MSLDHADLLDRIDAYQNRVPLSASKPEEVGPFTLFRPTGTTPYYARPRAGEPVTADDVRALADRCAELDLPVAIEWVAECSSGLDQAARDAGLTVVLHPLLALPPEVTPVVPELPGVTLERVPAEPDRVLRARAVASVAFRNPGTAVAEGGVEARKQMEEAFAPTRLADLVERVSSGVTGVVEARDAEGEVVASGQIQPAGDAAEIVAVATLPAFRRQGYAAAVTAALVAEARAGGADLVLLSAQDDAVARVYERVGFVRVGHAGAAEPQE
jgi:ribosomal protein S18 acetylase RimI-like enzyme